MRGIHRSPVNSPHKGQWRGTLMFSLICARINGWVNNRKAGDLKRNQAHYDVIVMQACAHVWHDHTELIYHWNTRIVMMPTLVVTGRMVTNGMETLSALLGFYERNPSATGRFPSQRVHAEEFWSFICYWPEQAVEQAVELAFIYDAMMLGWRHCDASITSSNRRRCMWDKYEFQNYDTQNQFIIMITAGGVRDVFI